MTATTPPRTRPVRPTFDRGHHPSASVDDRRRSNPAGLRGGSWVARLHLELVVPALLAALLDLWHITVSGNANEYYSAAVKSMTHSWSNFFWGSMDVHGVMTVDKPPLALWVQALSARAFGFSSASILVPSAVASILTVLLVGTMVRKVWGNGAALAAGLALAVTPVSVALARHNNPDALLALFVVAAVWCAVRAIDARRLRWFAASGAMVGLGFETKMAAALLVVPAIAIAATWTCSGVRNLLARGAAFAVPALVVGGAWPLAALLTPASHRPWISGTSDNSVWSLIVDYNGVGRVSGQLGGPSTMGASSIFGGAAGPFRLLDSSLGGQAGWFVALAAAALVVGLAATGLRRADPRTAWLLAVGGSFATIAVVFSTAKGIFHPYYVTEVAPFAALLVGAAVGLLRDRRLSHVVVVPALGATAIAGVAAVMVNVGSPSSHVVSLVLLGGAAVAVTALLPRRSWRLASVGAIGLVLLAAPASWAWSTTGHALGGTFPAGGGTTTSFGGGGGMFGGTDSSLTAATTWAAANGGGTVAVSSQSTAASAILAGNDDVVAIGGFSGNESAVTAKWLAAEAAEGKVRWVLTTSSGGMGGNSGGRVGATNAFAAVEATCTAVSSVSGLYDCSGSTAALRAYTTSSTTAATSAATTASTTTGATTSATNSAAGRSTTTTTGTTSTTGTN